MAGHDLKKLENELRAIYQLTEEMIKIIHFPGYTTPTEFALVLGATEGVAAQMRTLVSVSKEIVSRSR